MASQHGTEMPDDDPLDTAAGKPVIAGAFYLAAVLLFGAVAALPALWRWIASIVTD